MSKPAYPSIVEARKHAEAQEGNLRQAIKMGLAMKRELEEKKASQPTPDATGKCGELVTVEHQYWRDQTQEWLPTGFPDRYRKDGFSVRELVTRSQAEELLAAEIRRERDLAEKQLSEVVDRMSDDYLALKADNAALTARIKVQDQEISDQSDMIADQLKMTEALEAKLAAAEKALEPFVSFFNEAMKGFTEGYAERTPFDKPVLGWNNAYLLMQHFIEARAVLGGKPS